MIQPYTDAQLKQMIGWIWDRGDFRLILPPIFAKTANRSVEDIMDLMDQVRADKETRLAPNVDPDGLGDGK